MDFYDKRLSELAVEDEEVLALLDDVSKPYDDLVGYVEALHHDLWVKTLVFAVVATVALILSIVAVLMLYAPATGRA